MTAHTVDIAVVGAGFAGLGAAIRLRRRGFTDFVVFEAADEVGGTWRDNTYPGCACDVPSHLYSFSFALNPKWSNTFSGQQEIWDYLRDCADRFGIRPHLRLGHAVEDASWDEAQQHWRIETSKGAYLARVLIGAQGPLSQPSVPDIAGLASFTGTVFHSQQWDHEHDLTGRSVAAIGTGASAIQFVPEIQPKVGELRVFQRTAPWIMPRMSRQITKTEHAIYRYVPGAQRLMRLAVYWIRDLSGIGFQRPRINKLASRFSLAHLKRSVKDPQLRAKLTPSYVMGCKRVLISNDYWKSLEKPNVQLITAGIKEIRPKSIVTADGVEHEVDTIILGTGFHVTDTPVMDHIKGRGGASLAQVWTPTMRAYLGTTVSGFPNLFFLLGPNTGLGHTSVVLMIESQLNQVIKALEHMRAKGIHAIEPTQQALDRDVSKIDAKMAGTVWATGGCKSWYLDSTGRNSTLWPGFVTTFRLRLKKFRPADYTQVGANRELASTR